MVKIKDVFKEMQDNDILQERISGELTLVGKSIVWTYKIENDLENIEDDEDIDEDDFNMEDSVSIEEILNDTYEEDLEEIKDNICECEYFDDLVFSEPKLKNSTISFKISF